MKILITISIEGTIWGCDKIGGTITLSEYSKESHTIEITTTELHRVLKKRAADRGEKFEFDEPAFTAGVSDFSVSKY